MTSSPAFSCSALAMALHVQGNVPTLFHLSCFQMGEWRRMLVEKLQRLLKFPWWGRGTGLPSLSRWLQISKAEMSSLLFFLSQHLLSQTSQVGPQGLSLGLLQRSEWLRVAPGSPQIAVGEKGVSTPAMFFPTWGFASANFIFFGLSGCYPWSSQHPFPFCKGTQGIQKC